MTAPALALKRGSSVERWHELSRASASGSCDVQLFPLIDRKNQGRRVGRPPFRPTVEQRKAVYALAACGIPQETICAVIHRMDGRPISGNTLRKHFGDELALGMMDANVAVAKALFDAAMRGSVTAQIFWLKCRAGWGEAPRRTEPAASQVLPVRPALLVQFGEMFAPAQGDSGVLGLVEGTARGAPQEQRVPPTLTQACSG